MKVINKFHSKIYLFKAIVVNVVLNRVISPVWCTLPYENIKYWAVILLKYDESISLLA